MILTSVIQWIWTIINPLLALIPTIDLAGWLVGGTFWDAVKMAFWMLPVSTAVRIMTISFALWTLRVVVSLLKTLWSVLPIV